MKDYWNNLFTERTTEFPPEAILCQDLHLLKKGRLLDYGAGDGRNSLYLAQEGFSVTAADYSEEGLAKLREKAKDRAIEIHTACVDLLQLKDDAFNIEFDSIISVHSFLGVPALQRVMSFLQPEGLFYGLSFQKEDCAPKSSRYSIGVSQGEIAQIKKMFKLINEDYLHDERGRFYRFIISK